MSFILSFTWINYYKESYNLETPFTDGFFHFVSFGKPTTTFYKIADISIQSDNSKILLHSFKYSLSFI